MLPVGEQPKSNWIGQIIASLLNQYNVSYSMPWYQLPKELKKILLYGTNKKDSVIIDVKSKNFEGAYSGSFEGVIKNLERRYTQTKSNHAREWIEKFMAIQPCASCNGGRLQKKHLAVYINDINIQEIGNLSISEAIKFLKSLNLNKQQQLISKSIIKEIIDRLIFLENVGLEYLNLNRSSATLSGGESQRIKLAAQIGLNLVGVMYILDEPSIGLHQRDNHRLITTLKNLRNMGNTVIVVEHDEETMLAADWIVDIGPGAGIHGGEIIAEGTPSSIMKNPKSITGSFLSQKEQINYSKNRRKGNNKYLILNNATGNNLQNVTLKIPLKKVYLCYWCIRFW